MNNKKLIRLTESDLHRIVKESVNKVLNEMGPGQANLLGRAAARRRKIGDYTRANDIENYYMKRMQPNLHRNYALNAIDPFKHGENKQNAFMQSVDDYNYYNRHGDFDKSDAEYDKLKTYKDDFETDYDRWKNTPTHKQNERNMLNNYRLDSI